MQKKRKCKRNDIATEKGFGEKQNFKKTLLKSEMDLQKIKNERNYYNEKTYTNESDSSKMSRLLLFFCKRSGTLSSLRLSTSLV